MDPRIIQKYATESKGSYFRDPQGELSGTVTCARQKLDLMCDNVQTVSIKLAKLAWESKK